MAQIGQILVEYTKYLTDRVNAMTEPGAGHGMHGVVVREDFNPEAMVMAFLADIDKREWMPTTGADPEEAEPEPDVDAVDIDAIVDYCEGMALNESAATPIRLKAAEVVMRWYDTVAYLDKEDAVEVRQGPWPFLPGQRAPQIPTEPRGY